jgi:hypothetical protein
MESNTWCPRLSGPAVEVKGLVMVGLSDEVVDGGLEIDHTTEDTSL